MHTQATKLTQFGRNEMVVLITSIPELFFKEFFKPFFLFQVEHSCSSSLLTCADLLRCTQ